MFKTLAGFDFSFQPSLDKVTKIVPSRSHSSALSSAARLCISSDHRERTKATWPPLSAPRPSRPEEGLRHDAGRSDRRALTRRTRRLAAGGHPLLLQVELADRRRDRLSSCDRRRGQSVLPTRQCPLRTWGNDPHLKSWLCRMGRCFGDPVVATALLARLLHHAVVVQIEGSSYRLRQHAELMPEHDRSKALITPPAFTPPPNPRGRPPKTAGIPSRHDPAAISAAFLYQRLPGLLCCRVRSRPQDPPRQSQEI